MGRHTLTIGEFTTVQVMQLVKELKDQSRWFLSGMVVIMKFLVRSGVTISIEILTSIIWKAVTPIKSC